MVDPLLVSDLSKARSIYDQAYKFYYDKYVAGLAPASQARALSAPIMSEGPRGEVLRLFTPQSQELRNEWGNDMYSFPMRVICDRDIDAAEAKTVIDRRKYIYPIWRQIPWPLIADKDWFHRCSNNIKIAGCNYAFKDVRFYSQKFNGKFWDEAKSWDKLDWELKFALTLMPNVDSITDCVFSKAEKWAEGKARTAKWSTIGFGVAGFILNVVIPAPILTDMLLDLATGDEVARINKQVEEAILATGQVPDYLIPLYKYWSDVMTRWNEREIGKTIPGHPETGEPIAQEVKAQPVVLAPVIFGGSDMLKMAGIGASAIAFFASQNKFIKISSAAIGGWLLWSVLSKR